jgi:hypothetical protein
MNTTTISATPAKGGFRSWLRKFGPQLRRAFELSALPYMNGPMPPL